MWPSWTVAVLIDSTAAQAGAQTELAIQLTASGASRHARTPRIEALLALSLRVLPRDVVHDGELDECTENERQTAAGPHVHRFCVADRRQTGVYTRVLSGHREQTGHAEQHSGRRAVRVDPEGDPRDDDQHTAGHVDQNEIVGELALEYEIDVDAAVLACGGRGRS